LPPRFQCAFTGQIISVAEAVDGDFPAVLFDFQKRFFRFRHAGGREKNFCDQRFHNLPFYTPNYQSAMHTTGFEDRKAFALQTLLFGMDAPFYETRFHDRILRNSSSLQRVSFSGSERWWIQYIIYDHKANLENKPGHGGRPLLDRGNAC
jgi:hypothetical protein